MIAVNCFCKLIVYYKLTSQLADDTIILTERKSHHYSEICIIRVHKISIQPWPLPEGSGLWTAI